MPISCNVLAASAERQLLAQNKSDCQVGQTHLCDRDFADLPRTEMPRGHETPHRPALHAVIPGYRGYQLRWQCQHATDQTPVAVLPLWFRFSLWRRVITGMIVDMKTLFLGGECASAGGLGRGWQVLAFPVMRNCLVLEHFFRSRLTPIQRK